LHDLRGIRRAVKQQGTGNKRRTLETPRALSAWATGAAEALSAETTEATEAGAATKSGATEPEPATASESSAIGAETSCSRLRLGSMPAALRAVTFCASSV
jgi:hypothetical protein